MRVQRHTSGSVRYDKRRKTWNYLWYDSGKRRSKLIGTKREFPTKAAAWKAAWRFRSWLQVVGTPVAVQQKLMRHADILTTMNTYGDTFQPELADAASKMAGLVLNGAQGELSLLFWRKRVRVERTDDIKDAARRF